MQPITTQPAGNGLRLAKIIKPHPSGQAHDIVFLDDFSKAVGVQSVGTHASNNAGTVNMHEPDVDDADPWSPKLFSANDQRKRDIIAVVAMVGVTPIIIGHLPPQISQLNFPDTLEYRNLHINRHASDFVTSTDQYGNYDLKHPSGAYLSISTTGSPPDFTAKDVDKEWTITKNTGKNLFIKCKTGGATVTLSYQGVVTIDARCTPVGDVNISAEGNISEAADKNIGINAGLVVSIHGGDAVNITAPVINLN